MEREFPSADIKEIRKSNILILAPSHYPLVAAIDIRPSKESAPTIARLDLEQTLAPCPQLPDVEIEYDIGVVKSLRQAYEIAPEDDHQYITAVVSQNVLNHLNQTRVELSSDDDDNYKSYLILIDYFTTLKKTRTWQEISNHLRRTQPAPVARLTNDFVKTQTYWELDNRNYISGANGAKTIWQRD